MGALSYLETYSSERTIKTYRTAIHNFLKIVYGEGELEQLVEKYVSEQRDNKIDLQKFLASLNGRPPITVRVYLSAVKVFLIENGIELPQREWRHLTRRIDGTMARTMDKVPSREELRRILAHMPINGKALYLTLVSSGMRIGEALQIELSDIDLEKNPAKITIRGEFTKSGDPRIAFISGEAKEHIKEWLKVREDYIESACKRQMSQVHDKSVEDNRVFPFHFSTARDILVRVLRKCGLDEKDKSTNILKIHPHSLRKFFRTQMATVVPVDIVEALMGHKGYLTKVYRRYTEEQLAKFYEQGETTVTVFGSVEEALEVKKDVRELEAVVHDQRKTIHSLVRTLNMLEERLSILEEQNENQEIKKSLPPVSREEIARAKKKQEKLTTNQ